jgi:hypothetical protein
MTELLDDDNRGIDHGSKNCRRVHCISSGPPGKYHHGDGWLVLVARSHQQNTVKVTSSCIIADSAPLLDCMLLMKVKSDFQ